MNYNNFILGDKNKWKTFEKTYHIGILMEKNMRRTQETEGKHILPELEGSQCYFAWPITLVVLERDSAARLDVIEI